MKKVFQTGATDCLKACIASITGEDINRVPDFSANMTNWMRNIKRYLARRGFATKAVSNCGEIDQRCYSIAAVDPFVFNGAVIAHAVIVRGGKVVHDPARRKIKKNYELVYGLEISRV